MNYMRRLQGITGSKTWQLAPCQTWQLPVPTLGLRVTFFNIWNLNLCFELISVIARSEKSLKRRWGGKSWRKCRGSVNWARLNARFCARALCTWGSTMLCERDHCTIPLILIGWKSTQLVGVVYSGGYPARVMHVLCTLHVLSSTCCVKPSCYDCWSLCSDYWNQICAIFSWSSSINQSMYAHF